LLDKIKNKILISLVVAGAIYLGFSIYANFDNVISAFQTFNWFWLPVLLLLSFANYFVRFLKWDYYLSITKVEIGKLDSFSIFMSGLIMSITPGKVGELLKCYLVKQIKNIPISKTVPIIFAERITDFTSLMIIAVIGAYSFSYGKEIVITVTLFLILLLIILSNKKIALPFFKLLEKNKFLYKHLEKIHSAYESSYQMLRPFPLFYMTVVSFISWSFECLSYYLILIIFKIDVSLLWSGFTYAFATIIGALSMLPGGLGATEGSLTFLVINKGYPKDLAVASTFIIRVVTLWFAILIGIISVSFYQKRFGKIYVEPVSNQ
jgi:glycosyltransferase 2 family protein